MLIPYEKDNIDDNTGVRQSYSDGSDGHNDDDTRWRRCHNSGHHVQK